MEQPTSPVTPDLTLLPARMLNEYAYCPRLCYLEWVQGEFTDSADTLDGRLRHQRVDQEQGDLPAAGKIPEAEETIHARSVSLSSETLGLSARIDLVELDNGAVTPVDYKRGKPSKTGEPVWESDAVQLGAQALLLQEHGYHCTHGIIYYSSTKQRIPVEITPQLTDQTITAIASARSMAGSGAIPPPLIDSPKCVRCSLAGICLPDEVNTMMHRQPSPDIPPRRLLHAHQLA
ncbi:MAG: CRISPR-associated protein Cas4, partial [Chloroflexi bacterium]|nr:CRISPR-associated protein Cas4 [Chloroflexota bacterium]